MKILLFANTDWYLYNFRLSLAQRLRDEGWEVVLVSPAGEYGLRLRKLGFRWVPIDFAPGSINPFGELGVLRRIWRLYQVEKPDLCHHFTIKCVLYGSLAARLVGVPAVVNAVTGMGHIFTDSGIKARLLRPLVRKFYRFALGRWGSRVIFQNDEDCGYFISNNMVRAENTTLIRGSGVNCNLYRPASKQVCTGNSDPDSAMTGSVRVLFASRLLREKGVFELLAAARKLKALGERITFVFAGDIYPGNPSSLNNDDLDAIYAEGLVDYRGHVDDVLPLLAEADVVVLPSYREGTPRILIEAAAMGKPIIATDIAGCRGLVRHGENGLLVPVKAVQPLVDALLTLARNSELRQEMGVAGRKIVLDEFDEDIVISNTINIYHRLFSENKNSSVAKTMESK